MNKKLVTPNPTEGTLLEVNVTTWWDNRPYVGYILHNTPLGTGNYGGDWREMWLTEEQMETFISRCEYEFEYEFDLTKVDTATALDGETVIHLYKAIDNWLDLDGIWIDEAGKVLA
jgi:hypothetical protein